MINEQLLNYIKKELSSNVSKDIITSNLKSKGWTDFDISEAFSKIISLKVEPVIPTVPPNIFRSSQPQIQNQNQPQTTTPVTSPVTPKITPEIARPQITPQTQPQTINLSATSPITPPLQTTPKPQPVIPQTPSQVTPQTPPQTIRPFTTPQTLSQPAPLQATPFNSPINNQVSNPTILSTHKKSKVPLIIFILFLFALLGGGAYAYYSGIFLTFSDLTSKAIVNTRNTNSASFDTTIKVDYSEIKQFTNQPLSEIMTPTQFSLTTKGAYDFSDSTNRKISTSLSLDASTISGQVDFKIVDNTIYGQLVKIPAQALAFIPTTTNFENKWFSFPIKPENIQSLTDLINPLSKISGIDSSVIEKITQEQKDKLFEITQNAHFLKMTKRLSPEAINDHLSYHFTFDLDKEGISTYLTTLKDYVNTIGKNDSALSLFDPTSITKSLDKIEDFQGEIWIGRKDNLPYKIMFNFGVKLDQTKNEKIKISVVNIFSNWNSPESIVVPTESLPFEEFVNALTNNAMSEAKGKAADAAIKAHLSNLRASAEIYFDSNTNSYLGLCSSTESKNIDAALKNVGTVFSCKDSIAKYLATVKFVQDPGYFCLDSTGFLNIIKALPKNGFSCPLK
ncbi:MAG: hypothetical protein WDK96_03625 [Candidatus Paceibacterota bacterium]|jgi:hypothetical protein